MIASRENARQLDSSFHRLGYKPANVKIFLEDVALYTLRRLD